MNTTELSH